MKSKKVWAILLAAVTVVSISGAALAAGVTRSSAPVKKVEAGEPYTEPYVAPAFPQQQVEKQYIVNREDGAVEYVTCGKTETTAGAPADVIDKKIVYPDGRTEHYKETVINFADGSRAVRINHEDGSLTEVSQNKPKADGSYSKIETKTDANGNVLSKKSEEVYADGTCVVTIEEAGHFMTLKGSIGDDPVLSPTNGESAGNLKSLTIDGRTYRIA